MVAVIPRWWRRTYRIPRFRAVRSGQPFAKHRQTPGRAGEAVLRMRAHRAPAWIPSDGVTSHAAGLPSAGVTSDAAGPPSAGVTSDAACPKCSLMKRCRIEDGRGRCVRVVTAHADDAALFPGGTIARWAEAWGNFGLVRTHRPFGNHMECHRAIGWRCAMTSATPASRRQAHTSSPTRSGSAPVGRSAIVRSVLRCCSVAATRRRGAVAAGRVNCWRCRPRRQLTVRSGSPTDAAASRLRS